MALALSASVRRSDTPEEAARPRAESHAPATRRGAPDDAFAAVEIFRDIDAVAPVWDALIGQSLATPYQTRAFLEPWVDHAAGPAGVEPLIVVARDASGPVALLPFGVRRRFGVRFAGFLGGSHANYNAPVIRLDRIDRFTAAETERLLRETARLAAVDAFALVNQPDAWRGVANPFAALAGQPSPDPAFSGPLADDYDQHLRKTLSSKARSKQRRKMRRFEELGATRIWRAETEAERTRLLGAYLAQKREQLLARGIASVFDRPGVSAFLAAACGATGEARAVDLYGFELEGEIIAVTGALPLGDRLSCMFNSIASGETAKYSPGELLLGFVVEDAIGRGVRTFDLGVGAAGYKRMFCPEVDQLSDSIIGVTLRGRAAATTLGALRSAKARIKASPTAYGLIEKARRLARGRGAEDVQPEDD